MKKLVKSVCFGAALSLSLSTSSHGATSTVDVFPRLRASVANQGLGYVVKNNQLWEFQRAKDGGATWVRFSASWQRIEDMDGNLSSDSITENALQKCKDLGLRPILNASYGPPREKVATLTLSRNYSAGAEWIQVDENISSIPSNGFGFIEKNDGKSISQKKAYYGTLIRGKNNSQRRIRLASKLNISLNKGQKLAVNKLRYTSPNTTNKNNSSLQAYKRYAHYLSRLINNKGLAGQVELWNEPVWAGDPWDVRGNFYDNKPSNIIGGANNPGMLRAMLDSAPAGAVRYNWSGGHKTRLDILESVSNPTQTQVVNRVAYDSWHPYKGEANLWNPATYQPLEGTNSKSSRRNMYKQIQDWRKAKGWAPEQSITEMGTSTSNQDKKAIYATRNYLAYMSLGFKYICFYRLAGDANSFPFVEADNRSNKRAYTAMKNLIAEFNRIRYNPVSFNKNQDIPKVGNYSGAYPLMVVPVSGRTSSSATKNTVIMTAWQRTFKPGKYRGADWLTVASPANASVNYTIPSGFTVQRAWNLVNGNTVNYSTSGGKVFIQVKDAPIAVEFLGN